MKHSQLLKRRTVIALLAMGALLIFGPQAVLTRTHSQRKPQRSIQRKRQARPKEAPKQEPQSVSALPEGKTSQALISEDPRAQYFHIKKAFSELPGMELFPYSLESGETV